MRNANLHTSMFEGDYIKFVENNSTHNMFFLLVFIFTTMIQRNQVSCETSIKMFVLGVKNKEYQVKSEIAKL